MSKLLAIILMFVLSGCHCGKRCVKSHQEICNDYTNYIVLGVPIITQHQCTVCDQWE